MTQPVPEPSIEIRPATSKDINEIVIPSWLQSYSRSLPAKLMRADSRYGLGRERYWSAMRARIERILATATTSVRVAVIDGITAGWVCDDQRNRVLFYAYVKDSFRRSGLGKALYGWIDDANKGAVTLAFMPPPWFSRPQTDGKLLWAPHQLIDVVSSY